jgi:hypothetical protein
MEELGRGWGRKETARLGPCGGGGKEERGPRGRGDWAGPRLLGLLSSLFLFFFCFSNSLIQTIPIDFKYNLNLNLYTQHK